MLGEGKWGDSHGMMLVSFLCFAESFVLGSKDLLTKETTHHTQ